MTNTPWHERVPPGILVGHPSHGVRYKFVSRLSAGGFGVVELYQDVSTNEFIAIKFLQRCRLVEHPKLHYYLEQEVLNHRWLRHPHIIQFRELFLTDQYVCIAMEYADAGTLLTVIKAGRRLPESLARWFFQQLLIALDYCHRPGPKGLAVRKPAVFNRDIKPENILLSRRPGFNVPFIKLCDFGFSKNDEQSQPGSWVGTEPYMAPEVLQAKEPGRSAYDGPKADAWSCGVTLYAMLTGKYPFASVRHALAAQWELPLEVEQSVSAECRDLLSRLLVGDPALRLNVSEALNHPWCQQDLPAGAATMNGQLLETADYGSLQSIADIQALLEQVTPRSSRVSLASQ